MKKFYLSLVCLFVLLASHVSATEILLGRYDLKGSNASGWSSYRGEIIIEAQGSNYGLIWMVGNNQTQIGTGILVKDILSVVYCDIRSNSYGVVSFQVLGNGQLKGYWSPINGTSYGTENLTWISY